ncbi:MAG TPA: hydantoinase B/oxoprolinase family protein [Candidatus Eisenbacteria bacterium]|nr:hydantoinase B/oxoprolinase family protein [Candidatus Eisenbacteria bacterium]
MKKTRPKRTPRRSNGAIDPIRYEMFLHRLWAIGEEGRMTLQRVTASPIVSQGGECMSSFYDEHGTMVLACSGHLRFAAATSDAITSLFQRFSKSPGFHEGDQFFFNDPYVAGSHTYDMMIIKPIFYRGALVAWTATSTHTADTGGVLRGGAYEIFHEGICIPGLKIVERGEFREDVFQTLTGQCRDPQYVGLDLKAMIAGNNICARRYLGLIEKFGLSFVQAAGAKMIEDSETKARAKLRSMPDGTWVTRQYVTTLDRKTRKSVAQQLFCTMTKKDDELRFDFTGTSPQTDTDHNSTLPSTVAHLALALTNTLFWDVPWSDGKMRPVKVHVPEGTILNCKYPAACGAGPRIGNVLVSTVCEAVAKMIYASGRYEDVNASTTGNLEFVGGPGYFYGGHTRQGIPVAQGLYDIHGAGMGAAPHRDGVNTGGHMNIPSAGISDVERIEMQYPFLYFTRAHNPDGSGFGQYRGGLGSYRIYLIYGSQDCSVDYKPYGGVAQGGFGLCGGYPTGIGANRLMIEAGLEMLERVASGDQPTVQAMRAGEWGKAFHPAGVPERIPLPEGSLLVDYVAGGGGFGDPIDRDPQLVLRDLTRGWVTRATAERIYGVVLTNGHAVDDAATHAARERIREERRAEKPISGKTSASDVSSTDGWRSLMRFHAVLEVAANGGSKAIRCRRCGHVYCEARDNYKRYALHRAVHLKEIMPPLPTGEPYVGEYHFYFCPGCATQLQVDLFTPSLGGEPVLWDTRLAV